MKINKSIILEINGIKFAAELNDTKTADALYSKLPLKIRMTRWGGEYYGGCPVEYFDEDEKRVKMKNGELAFWPDGSALCIFFGPTPSSTDSSPAAVSPVIPLGIITGDTEALNNFGPEVEVTVRRAK